MDTDGKKINFVVVVIARAAVIEAYANEEQTILELLQWIKYGILLVFFLCPTSPIDMESQINSEYECLSLPVSIPF